MARKKTKKKEPVNYRVYVTFIDDGRYYCGQSRKPEKAYGKYYGSNKEILALAKTSPERLKKFTLAELQPNVTTAKFIELVLQIQNREDDLCINQMMNVRFNLKNVKITSGQLQKISEVLEVLKDLYCKGF